MTKLQKKKLNKMGTSNLPNEEFKTLVIRMLSELSEDLNHIKKIQSEMKDTLIEIKKKNNLHETNSKVDEAKNQISDLEYKEEKNTQPEQQKKTESKKKIV